MILLDRDLEILRTVCLFGYITALQASQFFELPLKLCQKRLRVLVNKSYLEKVPIPTIHAGRSPNLFFLSKKSCEEIFSIQSMRPRLNWKTTHAMKNVDILINIAITFRKLGVECELLPEHIIRASEQDVIPDGSFMLRRENKTALFLMEHCAGTETISSPSLNNDVETKLIRHAEVFEENKIDLYKNYFGVKDLKRFRLLFIANSIQRLNSICEVAKEHDRHGFMYFATMQEFNIKGICGNIWRVPARNKTGLSII